jgi:hypothetical protein
MRACTKRLRFLLSNLTFLLCASCANHHYHVAAPAEGPGNGAPRYVELLGETRVATLHFPAGLYSFYAVDDVGYYYRSRQKVVEHSRGSSILHNGGIYVNKRNMKKLRGYVYLGGALVHVGDFSRIKYELHD